jgi:hypothetical protein
VVRHPWPPGGRLLLVHCSHHKAGTNWIRNILVDVANTYGLRLADIDRDTIASSADIAFFGQAWKFDRSSLGGRPFRGSHLIRDPRDLVVSGYHYHLWTTEAWTHEPRPRFGGKSYQELLNSVPREEGIAFEIRRSLRWDIAKMAAWDYHQPEFCELRYEDVMADEAGAFERLFTHYGFTPRAVDACVAIGLRHGFKAVKEREGPKEGPSHLRSGTPGEWRSTFTDEHKALFKSLGGDVLIKLGYETSDDW